MKKLLAFLCVMFAFAACKKDAVLPAPITTDTQSFSLTNDTGIYAWFQFFENQSLTYYGGLTPYTTYQAIADFSSVPRQSPSYYATAVSVDSCFLNNVYFLYDTLYRRYDGYYYSFPQTASNCVWRVVGANGIPSFTFSGNPLPTFDYTLLPDTIDHTQAITLPIHITSSSDATIGFDISPQKTFNPKSTDSVYYSVGALDSATHYSSAGNYLNLLLYAYNINSYKVYGKTMNFRCIYTFSKKFYLK